MFKKVKGQSIRLITTAFTVAELYYGAFISSNSAKNLRDVQDFLSEFEILDFNEGSAKIYAQIAADLKNKGQPIGLIDPFIASIILQHNETLITRNVKHFENIERLAMTNWEG
ncbi:MAG: putative nucleic acid-binding protein [Promethearchaeota archaeon CR_4]|nr:MAG: putative nucleic acid-binding protein [Candidatus Lokiarchaeota archaeon CR_4]